MFPDLTRHPDYLKPQSLAWCNQLAARTGKYEFPWRSVYEGPTDEEVLTDKLISAARGRVLDVGCAHGGYTSRWASQAEEVVGYDMTEGFLATADRNRPPNVRYVLGNTHDGLPFPNDTFDMAYTKKGPTSWYKEGNRVVRPGGAIVLFHPGDGNGEGGELGIVFPGLFAPPAAGTPILDQIRERLADSGLTDIRLTTLRETAWLPSPEDVFEIACFGQSDEFRAYAREQCYGRIVKQFEKHAGDKGLRTTGFHYLIEAKER
ncbi:class I SAM-dependent methyltransferase [Cohnella sp. REN36]|uniref:class I SAM-dependent methyltransferase n=1 Tax=Cohnella sp. REN36 TaxID=2887347 RepID=UPI001D147322|nr:class I SAM-dependent methyltransferase [Cohnella sp. REN36]MCC3376294.1 class I SAM-dependent methyltransferase [Cohnella sp. REN36]